MFYNYAAPTVLLAEGHRLNREPREIHEQFQNKISFAYLACFAVEIDLRLPSVFFRVHLWLKIIMPTDLIHRIGIAAPAETIYRALTTEEGIKAWWTTDVKMDASAVGATSL